VDVDDLSTDAVAAALPDRPIRVYPALLSTQADALAWARAGAPEGSLVVADYQASPRGRAGLEWRVEPGTSLGFSLILHPSLSAEREGWLYTIATSAVADFFGEKAAIAWPDEIRVNGEVVAAVGVDVELGPEGTEWAVVNILIQQSSRPRPVALGRIVESIERRYRSVPAEVLNDYLPRLLTMGRRVSARLIPLGPGGVAITGEAVGCLMDGALLIENDNGRRVAVRPQHLGVLDDA
jgi:BirA family biotin operon repressor/biotin-[acetyl-CoA-carboxylase] ligase